MVIGNTTTTTSINPPPKKINTSFVLSLSDDDAQVSENKDDLGSLLVEMQ